MAQTHEQSALGKCPACAADLYSSDVNLGTFNCPHCSKLLKTARGRGYRWGRTLFIVGGSLVWAWHGWDDSFMLFTLGFYALALSLAWSVMESSFLPPRKFEIAGSTFLTLGLGAGASNSRSTAPPPEIPSD